MKITLLYPAITVDGFAKDGVRPKTGWIHHGLCYISAALKAKGHSVSLIDLRQLNGWAELPGAIRKESPEVIGITMMSSDFDAALESARIAKETNRRIKVIVGGIHPSVMESELLGNSCIDYIFKGEAETTLPLIVNDIARGGIKEKVIIGEAPELNKTPFADRSLFGIFEVPLVPFLKMPFITIVAGRGCLYNCNFCQPAERKIFGNKVRRMSVERLIDELKTVKARIGLNSVMIHDDCIVEDTAWVEKFLKLYSAKGLNKPFICQSRADIVVKNPALFKDMRRHGLEMLIIGFESGSQRILNFLRKGTTVEQNYLAAKICKRLGIRVFANFMLGIPTETKDEALETVKMIKKIKPYVPSPAFYTPLPGSDLFEYCMKNNLSLIDKHDGYNRSPVAPKVRGVDYEFLSRILREAVRIGPFVRVRRKIDKLRLGRFNKNFIKELQGA